MKITKCNVCLIVWCSLLGFMNASDCSTVYTGLPTFRNCQFRCHCINDVPCDEVTGTCPDGCSSGWLGPACQYSGVNVVRSLRRTLTNGVQTSSPLLSTLAADGQLTTCSKTGIANDEHWWKVELHAIEKVQALVLFFNRNDDLRIYKGIKIEYGSSWDTTSVLAYQLKGVPTHFRLEIFFEQSFETKFLRVRMSQRKFHLSLCEVEIYSEVWRELAFNRPTNGSAQATGWTSSRAVDGYFFNHPASLDNSVLRLSCFSGTDTVSRIPWWSVDLGREYSLRYLHVFGEGKLETIQDFVVMTRSSTDQAFIWFYKYLTTSPTPTPTLIASGTVGREVKVHIDSVDVLKICEFRIYGDCPTNSCGWDCSLRCFCAAETINLEHKILGTCPNGCLEGWKGDDKSCDVPLKCPDGFYGERCYEKCGKCLNSNCHNITGECRDGCTHGFVGSRCQEPAGNEEGKSMSFADGIGIGIGGSVFIFPFVLITVLLVYRNKIKRETVKKKENHYDRRVGARESEQYSNLEVAIKGRT